MFIITLEGQALADLLAEALAEGRAIHTVRVARDGDGVKFKINEGMWTPGYPAAAEDLRRDVTGRNRWV